MNKYAVFAKLLLITACATTSIEEADQASRDELPVLPTDWVQDADSSPVADGWLSKLDDPNLAQLIAIAQQENQDLRSAAANVERSRAILVQAGASLVPEVSAVASVDATGDSGESGTLTRSSFAGLSMSWEVDVWGRIRAGRQASVASFLSAEEDYRFAQYSVAAQVARSYFSAIEAKLQSRVTSETLTALEGTDRIVRARREEGEATAEDTALSNAEVEAIRANLVVNRADYRSAVRALQVLLNQYPDTELLIPESFPGFPPTPDAGVPATLLERRPDVLSASRRVASATNSIAEAQAARLPTISITGSYGAASEVGATGLSNSLGLEDLLWSAAGDLVGPIFDAGRRKAQVAIERADLEEAYADYVTVALGAFQEVEDSLDQGKAARDQVRHLERATSSATDAFDLAQFRYEQGATDLVDVLDIRRRVLENQSGLVSAQRSALDQWVALNLALGGSWKTEVEVDEAQGDRMTMR